MQVNPRKVFTSNNTLGISRHRRPRNTKHQSMWQSTKRSHMPGCQPVLHVAKSDLAAPTCLAGHWVLYRCRIHKQSGVQGNKQLFFFLLSLIVFFNIKGCVAMQKLWLELKASFNGLFIVKFSFYSKVGHSKEMDFKVKWIHAFQTWPTTS